MPQRQGLDTGSRPEPEVAGIDVLVEVHASGFTPGELSWPSNWTDRLGRDRTPSIPGHELAGVVRTLGYGTRGLSVGQRVFGLTDWSRDGTLAEHAAVEARNLAPLPGASTSRWARVCRSGSTPPSQPSNPTRQPLPLDKLNAGCLDTGEHRPQSPAQQQAPHGLDGMKERGLRSSWTPE
jgi:hypothetical protein